AGPCPLPGPGTPPPLQGVDLPLRPLPRLQVGPPQLMHDEQQHHHAARHGHLGPHPQRPRDDHPPRPPPLHHHRNPLPHARPPPHRRTISAPPPTHQSATFP